MRPEKKRVFIFWSIFAIVFSGILYASDIFADKCSMEYATKKWERTVTRSSAESALKDMDRAIAKMDIASSEDKAAAKLAMGQYVILLSNQCDIPLDLEARMFRSLGLDEIGEELDTKNAKGKVCADDAYMSDVEKALSDLKSAPARYKKLTDMLYEKMFAHQDYSPKVKSHVDTWWQKQETQDDAIRMYMQARVMVGMNCQNPSRPMQEYAKKIFKESVMHTLQQHK